MNDPKMDDDNTTNNNLPQEIEIDWRSIPQPAPAEGLEYAGPGGVGDHAHMLREESLSKHLSSANQTTMTILAYPTYAASDRGWTTAANTPVAVEAVPFQIAALPPPPLPDLPPLSPSDEMFGGGVARAVTEKHGGGGDGNGERIGGASRGPFGMRIWVFAGVAVLVGFLLGGVIIGGALGAALASRPSSPQPTIITNAAASVPLATPAPASAAPTTTTTTSSSTSSSSIALPTTQVDNYAPVPPQLVRSTTFSCPRLQGTTYTTFDGKVFGIECGVDNLGPGREAPGTDIGDIIAIPAYSYEQCLDSCASLNRHASLIPGRPSVLVCRSAVFRRSMNDYLASTEGGNCFLKNATRAATNGGRLDENLLTGSLT